MGRAGPASSSRPGSRTYGSAATTSGRRRSTPGRNGSGCSPAAASRCTPSSSTTAKDSPSIAPAAWRRCCAPSPTSANRRCSASLFRALLARRWRWRRGRRRSVARGFAGPRVGLAARAVEILVPAAALQLERVPAHDLRHLAAALGALVRRRIAHLLQAFHDAAAVLADEFVDGHGEDLNPAPADLAAGLRPRG